MSDTQKAVPAHPADSKPKVKGRREGLSAVPRGEIDYDLLHKDVKSRFPKVLARLAE